ncbi:hypothetical protein EVAR_25912_1 [Eumeta japonica]|uniref:Uncharacterized protein n=1 Tax=Eumeta variegata TaxID=151549 RepID=A0A4C1W0Y5_EUMVA|nr:hypothetical protein EVAR_25912_1 [Eumeta japonica]
MEIEPTSPAQHVGSLLIALIGQSVLHRIYIGYFSDIVLNEVIRYDATNPCFNHARIERLGFEVALKESEALLIHGSRNAPPTGSYFVSLVPKLMKAAAAFGRIMPNLDGSNGACRSILTGVTRSMALYGALFSPLTVKTVALVRKLQRVMAIRIIRGLLDDFLRGGMRFGWIDLKQWLNT